MIRIELLSAENFKQDSLDNYPRKQDVKKVYHNEKTGFRSYFISFEDGARLEIMSKPEMEDNPKTPNRTGYAHIAFSVGSREKVDELTEKIRVAGYEVISGPRTTGDGYYESCIVAIENNQIEITE